VSRTFDRPTDEDTTRRRPHVPVRSRREYEAQQDALTGTTRDAEAAAPLWTARGRRLAVEAEEAALQAAWEAEEAAQRRALEERQRAEEAEAARIEAGMRRIRRLTRRQPGEEPGPGPDVETAEEATGAAFEAPTDTGPTEGVDAGTDADAANGDSTVDNAAAEVTTPPGTARKRRRVAPAGEPVGGTGDGQGEGDRADD
jgi:hypothetical protein